MHGTYTLIDRTLAILSGLKKRDISTQYAISGLKAHDNLDEAVLNREERDKFADLVEKRASFKGICDLLANGRTEEVQDRFSLELSSRYGLQMIDSISALTAELIMDYDEIWGVEQMFKEISLRIYNNLEVAPENSPNKIFLRHGFPISQMKEQARHIKGHQNITLDVARQRLTSIASTPIEMYAPVFKQVFLAEYYGTP